jgi:proteic killer suppression protein
MAIRSFKNLATETIACGQKTKRSLKCLPAELHFLAYKKLVFLDNISTLESLKAWPGLRFEKLSGNRSGEYSIRINNKYRICFRFINGNVFDVEITDYH